MKTFMVLCLKLAENHNSDHVDNHEHTELEKKLKLKNW